MKTVQLRKQKNQVLKYISEPTALKTPLVLVFGNRYMLEDASLFDEVRKKFPEGHLIFGRGGIQH